MTDRQELILARMRRKRNNMVAATYICQQPALIRKLAEEVGELDATIREYIRVNTAPKSTS